MLKRLLLLVFGCMLLNINHGKAMDEEDNQPKSPLKRTRPENNKQQEIDLDKPHALSNSPFGSLPLEMLLYIAQYLYGDNFNRFALTCKPIRNDLMGYPAFFIPEKEDNIETIIKETPLEKIPDLVDTWGRGNKNKTIEKLTIVLSSFEYTPPSKKETNVKPFSTVHRNHVKVLNLLYALGSPEANEKLVELCATGQTGMEESMQAQLEGEKVVKTVTNPTLYTFHMKNLSLLDPDMRNNLSKCYKEGSFPFEKNEQKCAKYQRITLPWDKVK